MQLSTGVFLVPRSNASSNLCSQICRRLISQRMRGVRRHRERFKNLMVNKMTISTLSNIAIDDYRSLIACLGVKHRSKEARRRLMHAGPEATSELRRGLKDVDPNVRISCCIVLDDHLGEEAIPDLIDNLSHVHP